jgi:hypothetical protein
MFSISLTPIKSQPLTTRIGFANISLQGSRRQFIEAQSGFKGISLMAQPSSIVVRLVRIRLYEQQ